MVFGETEKLYQDLSIYLSIGREDEKGKVSHDTSSKNPIVSRMLPNATGNKWRASMAISVSILCLEVIPVKS
jgi:hypothetical protein